MVQISLLACEMAFLIDSGSFDVAPVRNDHRPIRSLWYLATRLSSPSASLKFSLHFPIERLPRDPGATFLHRLPWGVDEAAFFFFSQASFRRFDPPPVIIS